MPNKSHFHTYFWPGLCGLLVAILISIAMPDRSSIGGAEPQAFESAPANPADTRIGPVSYANAVNRATPSVVSIYALVPVLQSQSRGFDDPFLRQFFNNGPTSEQQSGAGVIVDQNGFILTNRHLIEGADQIGIVTSDGRVAEATLVGQDAETDLAVLKIDLPDLTAISIGDSASVRVGDIVLAIGNPFGRGQTVTQGIVSATGRNLLDLSNYVNFLQTDAAINEGNSGGALIDAYGNLIGINTAILNASGAEGISFSIPADIAIDVVRQIIEHGSVTRGWIGVQQTKEVSSQRSQELSLGISNAMEITSLVTGGPAQIAGMEEGDIIYKVNGKDIIDGRQVVDLISNTKPGQIVTFGIYRGNKQLTIQVRTSVRPPR